MQRLYLYLLWSTMLCMTSCAIAADGNLAEQGIAPAEAQSQDVQKLSLFLPQEGIPLATSIAEGTHRVRDYVYVTNMTQQPWFAAMYTVPHDKTQPAQRYSLVIRITPGYTVNLPRPDFSLKERIRYDRLILFHSNRDRLKQTLSYKEHQQFSYIHAGITRGRRFFIAYDTDKAPRGYNIYAWNTRRISQKAEATMQHIYNAVAHPLMNRIRRKYLSPDINPWVNDTAHVQTRKHQQLDAQERIALKNRDGRIRKAVSRLIGRPLENHEPTPRVALVCSGGGFRAMFATLGTMQGAQQQGIWDALSYVVGLSGSTWAIAPYMVSDTPVSQFVDAAISRSTRGFSGMRQDIRTHRKEMKELLSEQLLSRISFQQGISLIDPYGFLLGRYLLKNTLTENKKAKQPHFITLADQKKRVRNGDVPFPIYTAVIGQTGDPQHRIDYDWLFFTPYEVGSQALGGYIPSWGFGRTYNQGRSVNKALPYNLGYCMGIWGSAFSGSLQDIYHMLLKDMNMSAVQKIFSELNRTNLGNQRFFPAHVPNMTYNMQQAPLSSRKHISLIDAGYAINVPIPAVIAPERKADVIIVLDASGGLATESEPEELKRAITYAEKHGVVMPHIDYRKAQQRIASVFTSQDSRAPAIVYMPMIANTSYGNLDPRKNLIQNGFLKTTNFFYKQQDAENFVGLCRRNMQDAIPQIRTALEHNIRHRAR